jgi:hypothetical protein
LPQLFPAVTHLWVDSSQQPPPLHELPGQHAWPEPPQVAHLPAPAPEHACPLTVQKLPDLPLPFELPGQQFWPFLPHVLVSQPPLWQLPTSPPHVVLFPTHPPAVQHALPVVHA